MDNRWTAACFLSDIYQGLGQQGWMEVEKSSLPHIAHGMASPVTTSPVFCNINSLPLPKLQVLQDSDKYSTLQGLVFKDVLLVFLSGCCFT